MPEQAKFEKITEKIVTRRFYRALLFPLEGGEGGVRRNKSRLGKALENIYFNIYRLFLIIYVLWLLSRNSFDLVLERNSAKGIGVFPAFLFRIRSVVEVIDPDFSRIQLSLASRILAYTKDIIPEMFRNKITLTHAGVDVELFRPIEDSGVRKHYSLDKEKVVVYVGELSEWHGVDMLLDVAERIDAKFLMIGKNLSELEKEAERRRIENKFIFLGFVKHEEVPKFISAADVCVVPYKLKDGKFKEEIK